MEEAQDAGVTVYWLGEKFQAGGIEYKIAGETQLIDRTGTIPGVKLFYRGPARGGSVVVDFDSYASSSGEPDAWKESLQDLPGASEQDATVAGYDGDVFLVPLDNRPVNQVWLFVDVQDSVLVATAFSGSNGIPGEDDNPLLDPDLLVETVGLHLQTFPD